MRLLIGTTRTCIQQRTDYTNLIVSLSFICYNLFANQFAYDQVKLQDRWIVFVNLKVQSDRPDYTIEAFGVK
jgi:hypothetical protein